MFPVTLDTINGRRITARLSLKWGTPFVSVYIAELSADLSPADARAIADALRAAAFEAEEMANVKPTSLTVEVPAAHVDAVKQYVDSVNGKVIS